MRINIPHYQPASPFSILDDATKELNQVAIEEAFRVVAKLNAPLIVRGHMTFDAILGALLFDRLDDVEAAHAAIPIKCIDGLYHASSASLKPIAKGSYTFTASLRPQHDLDPDLIKKNKDGTKLHRTITLGRRRDYGNVLNTYDTITTDTVEWDVVGDMQQVADLLADAHFIGKKRTAGFGEVKSWDIFESSTDGLLDQNGAPLRPIPVAMFTGDKSYPGVPLSGGPA
jgi:hypothetical protein